MSDRFARAWTDHRAYLVDLAFRMLGDIGEAQDAVQEAYVRLDRDLGAVDDERGWLTVVTSRLCLDRLRSAQARRERPEDDLGDAAAPVGAPWPVDPADRVTLDDEVRAALHLLLDRLDPAERVTLVLHDVFRVPFAEIAETLGRPISTCRQLARRARQKTGRQQIVAPTAQASSLADREVTSEFMRACTTGDLDGLLALLAPDAWGRADFAAGAPGKVNHGADAVAHTLVRFWGKNATMVGHPLLGNPPVLAYLDRDLAGVIELDIADGRIRSVWVKVLIATRGLSGPDQPNAGNTIGGNGRITPAGGDALALAD